MFSLTVFSLCLQFCLSSIHAYPSQSAYSYNSGPASVSSYQSLGYGSFGGFSALNAPSGIIPAAIQSRHRIEFVDVPSVSDIKPALVEVGANVIPLNILFRSSSSLLNVLQQHQGAPGNVQESSSEDEPHRLLHTVTKPIYQEVREVISPFRKITQEIQPVQEEIQTIVARDQLGRSLSKSLVSTSDGLKGSLELNSGGGDGHQLLTTGSLSPLTTADLQASKQYTAEKATLPLVASQVAAPASSISGIRVY